MLGRRLISAFVIISVMLGILRLDFWLGTPEMGNRPGIILGVLAILLATMAAGELVELWSTTSAKPAVVTVSLATCLMVSVACVPAFGGFLRSDFSAAPTALTHPLAWSVLGLLAAVALSFCWEMAVFDIDDGDPGRVANRLGRSIFAYVYLGMLFGFLVPHRFLAGSNAMGLISLVALISTVKLSDAFAYFAGKSFGTIQMAPKLSPGKTVQGSIGALVGGCTAAAIVIYLVAPQIFGITIDKPWWWFLAYGLLVTIAGMIGDLAESLLKRDAHCKDSSSWLPGLGGLLDVLDSLIFAAPVSWLIWVI